MTKEEILIKEVENRVVKCILDDIDFGYDLQIIKGKIKAGSYVGNSPETFENFESENERLKAERDLLHKHYKSAGQDLLVCFKMLSELRLSSTMKQILEQMKQSQRKRFEVVSESQPPKQ